MTVETKISAKGRVSYFSNGSQTRLGDIVDELIGGAQVEIINPNGDRKIFEGYTSKTRKQIAEFFKAEAPQADTLANVDVEEYAVTVEAQDSAVDAEIELANDT